MIHAIWRAILRVVFRVRVDGDVRVLEGGHRLVVANHDSLLDGVLLGLFLPNLPTVVVTPEALRHPVARLFRSAVRFVVLDPAKPLALKALIREVRNGGTVVIFPQGRVTTTGALMKVYESAGVIAARSDAQIVPVHIAGTLCSHFSAVRGAFPRKLFPRVTLTVHPPVTMARPAGVQARDRRRLLGDEMLRLMQRMLFDSRRRQTLFEAFLDAMELHGRGTRIVEDVREIHAYK